MSPRKLGQHFLLDPSILGRIIEVAQITGEDFVLEIGPGLGRMTRMLCEAAGRVLAIELDDALYNRLRKELTGIHNLELVFGDCLKFPFEKLPPFTVVANIPYYITTPILFRLLEPGVKANRMVLTIQKEVAERIVARPGSPEYGVLSISVQARLKASLAFTVHRNAFTPPPRVDSAVISLAHMETPLVDEACFPGFMRMVRQVFRARRKTLWNGLKGYAPPDIVRAALSQLGIPPEIRAEKLDIPLLRQLASALHSDEKGSCRDQEP